MKMEPLLEKIERLECGEYGPLSDLDELKDAKNLANAAPLLQAALEDAVGVILRAMTVKKDWRHRRLRDEAVARSLVALAKSEGEIS